jgi:hypothetical protein
MPGREVGHLNWRPYLINHLCHRVFHVRRATELRLTWNPPF